MNQADHQEEELVRRVLEAAGPRHALPDALRERWETAFHAELDQVLHRRRRVKRNMLIAVAASVAAVAVALALLAFPTHPMPPVAIITAVHGHGELLGGGVVTTGMSVAAEQTIETGPAGRVSLRYHEADVRLDVSSKLELHDDRLTLAEGTLYVDTGTEGSAHGPVIIETALGTFSHLGTQFMVNLHDGALTAAVREGTILLTTDAARDSFSADAGSARLVSVSKAGAIDVAAVPTHGGIWTWVLEASPGFARDSATQDEFLRWLARETGTTLTYASDAARRHALLGRVVGLEGQPIDRAIEIVNLTTDLSVSADEGSELRVRLKD